MVNRSHPRLDARDSWSYCLFRALRGTASQRLTRTIGWTRHLTSSAGSLVGRLLTQGRKVSGGTTRTLGGWSETTPLSCTPTWSPKPSRVLRIKLCLGHSAGEWEEKQIRARSAL